MNHLSIALGFALIAVLVDAANAQPVNFKQLLDAARKEAGEGAFTVWASNPRTDETRRALFDAFKKKYNIPALTFEWLPLHPRDTAARVVAEIRAGRSGPDVVFGGQNSVVEIEEQGLVASLDWVSVFSQEFPKIKEAAHDRVPVELRGKWVALFDATRSFIFNTNMTKSSGVPDLIEDLGDPKWSRKFVMSSTGSSPWDLLVLRWGESRTLAVLNKLMSNKPIYKNGTPAVNTAVASGEAPVGLGSIHDTESLKAKGAPVDWKTYGVDAPGDYIPVLPQGLLVTKKSRHASLGRLFIAWFAMEGISITEKRESTFRITYEDSSLNALLKQRAPNAKVLAPLSNKEFEISNAFDDKVRQVVAGGMRGR